MADVTVSYKGSVIAELDGANKVKRLKTSGCYCDDHIDISYTPNSRTYEITLSKAYNWVLLTALDADVLEHINDEKLVVTLVNTNPHEFVSYAGNMYMAFNKTIGNFNGTTLYGVSNREYSATNMSFNGITLPANNTESIEDNASFGGFKVSDGKYYVRPGDGYIRAGNYKLTFTW